jgi:hypothetical protein
MVLGPKEAGFFNLCFTLVQYLLQLNSVCLQQLLMSITTQYVHPTVSTYDTNIPIFPKQSLLIRVKVAGQTGESQKR